MERAWRGHGEGMGRAWRGHAGRKAAWKRMKGHDGSSCHPLIHVTHGPTLHATHVTSLHDILISPTAPQVTYSHLYRRRVSVVRRRSHSAQPFLTANIRKVADLRQPRPPYTSEMGIRSACGEVGGGRSLQNDGRMGHQRCNRRGVQRQGEPVERCVESGVQDASEHLSTLGKWMI